MFRKSAYPKEGINPEVKHIADWAVTLEIVTKGKIGFLWEKLALYRVHSVSIMQSLKGSDDFVDKKTIIETFTKIHTNVNPSLFNNQWAYAYMVKAIDHLIYDQKYIAIKCLINSIRYNPFYSISAYIYLFMSPLPFKIYKSVMPKRYFK
jgi:hypothetical protein